MGEYNKRIDNLTCFYVILMGLFFLALGAISEFNYRIIVVATICIAFGVGQLIYNAICHQKEHQPKNKE